MRINAIRLVILILVMFLHNRSRLNLIREQFKSTPQEQDSALLTYELCYTLQAVAKVFWPTKSLKFDNICKQYPRNGYAQMLTFDGFVWIAVGDRTYICTFAFGIVIALMLSFFDILSHFSELWELSQFLQTDCLSSQSSRSGYLSQTYSTVIKINPVTIY